jgi:hypothetical protein
MKKETQEFIPIVMETLDILLLPSNFYIEGIELVKGELLDLLLEVENRGQRKDLLRFFDIQEELENLVIKKIEE